MEFKLNKIDPDLRRQVNEAAKSGKVHGAGHKLSVNKDKRDETEKHNSYKHKEKNQVILVNAEKKEDVDIEVISENDMANTEIKGRFIDVRK